MPATPKPLIDIRPDHWAIVHRILQKHVPQYEVWAFGSRAKWTAKEYSDLDLAVITDEPLSLSVSAALADDFSESDLPFKVDVVDWAATSESFHRVIESDKVVVQKAGTANITNVGRVSASVTRRATGETNEDIGLRDKAANPTYGRLSMEFDFPQSLPESWQVCRLDKVATVIDSLHKTPIYSETGHAMVRVTDVQGGFLDISKSLRVTEDVFHEFTRRYVPKRGDIVFSRVGSYGNVSYANTDVPFCLGQNTALLSPQINGRFLHLFLQSTDARRQIEKVVVGSTQKTISLKSISALQVPIPPDEELEAIAHVLGTLDDRIELNRRMNETLEAMARALFKSWFVDFDPVHVKAEGRDPGLPESLADLFPDSFEDSELGEIPKGWKIGTLGDLLAQRVERCVASSETAARPYVPIECISSKSLFLTESKPGEEAQSSLAKFYKGDLLFGAMRPYFHKVCIAPFDGTTRTTAFVLFPRAKEDFAFATLLLHHPDTIDYATRHSTGSTIPYAVWNSSLEEMPVIVPPSEVRSAFDGVMRPMLDRIPEPHFQNKALAALRDALLPKLLSGEVRIKDAARLIGEQA